MAENRYRFGDAGKASAVLKDLGMWTRGMLTHAADVCFGSKPAIRAVSDSPPAWELEYGHNSDMVPTPDGHLDLP